MRKCERRRQILIDFLGNSLQPGVLTQLIVRAREVLNQRAVGQSDS